MLKECNICDNIYSDSFDHCRACGAATVKINGKDVTIDYETGRILTRPQSRIHQGVVRTLSNILRAA